MQNPGAHVPWKISTMHARHTAVTHASGTHRSCMQMAHSNYTCMRHTASTHACGTQRLCLYAYLGQTVICRRHISMHWAYSHCESVRHMSITNAFMHACVKEILFCHWHPPMNGLEMPTPTYFHPPCHKHVPAYPRLYTQLLPQVQTANFSLASIHTCTIHTFVHRARARAMSVTLSCSRKHRLRTSSSTMLRSRLHVCVDVWMCERVGHIVIYHAAEPAACLCGAMGMAACSWRA